MSGKTKIVVLHMKELIYTGIFAALGILFIILLVIMFLPGKNNNNGNTSNEEQNSEAPSSENSAVASDSVYIPGIYTTELILGGQTIDVEVIVENDSITSIRMVNLSEAVTTMYPLLQPTFDSICQQVYETQSLEEITYSSDSKYTSLVLMEAIQTSLNKAKPTASPTPTATPATVATPSPAPSQTSTTNTVTVVYE